VIDERVERFLDLSVLLTGFGRVELLGTGMLEDYLGAVDDVLPAGLLDELFVAYEALPARDREAAAGFAIFDDATLGPVARNLILLWYCGTWTQLPEDWRRLHGTSPLDTHRVVSPASYLAGLQWVAAGAHPVGARQQGYGAWAVPPEAVGR
jgi:hypothetical protein